MQGWIRGNLLGGCTYLAINSESGELIAAKQVRLPLANTEDGGNELEHSRVRDLRHEMAVMKDLRHPHVVEYLGVEETAEYLTMFLDYVPGGSVSDLIKSYDAFEDSLARNFARQIVIGLEYLHGQGIIHCDLRANNILVANQGDCKITGFNKARRMRGDDVGVGMNVSENGLIFWTAPEVLLARAGYSAKSDVWSLGCTLIEMLTGERPWGTLGGATVLQKLASENPTPPMSSKLESELSPAANAFRQACFTVNPHNRPTAAELRTHEYLEQMNA